ncbi:uncharacterized protein LOC133624927 [Colius striatus]|uniref:uncharacterized protein LOC133624927 n=1 Tax=Colius striatus TaxID=57412 RepID=UPI002B1CE7E1|nr:uncharacterized protein LOC133624927 [Colius striatus]XP_061846217.1 uncharacterized protein LOC133624927 [Colius striatus]XP_061846218.1 uncharacterized protein LOC133624927 [Colius striatus]XP_061846219.1 uncharacterized protein LOC133624927 [Colius striatus]XP_061846220.1 uncharacterized protein LOC133624927 [Colius striatus]XP_061846221.1 uncharacterized protein LOC133624927 [Colius striatus]XP_061846222.1 uncharacterized protein LOC133624927 [Colius striatus]XP_061846224.1 uncharacte
MASSWRRKNKCKEGFPSQAADLGIFIQEINPKPWVEDAVLGEGFAKSSRPRKSWKLSKGLWLLWHMIRQKGGRKKCQAPQKSGQRQRDAGTQARAVERFAEVEGTARGLPEEPRTCQKASQRQQKPPQGQQEEQVALVPTVNVLSVVPHRGEGSQDELIIWSKAQDGAVPSGGGGQGGEMGQTQPLVQAGVNGDEGGRTSMSAWWVEDKGAATVPPGDCNRAGQDRNSPSSERRCGDERRRQTWEKLQQLGEDMVRWEGRPTRELAVRLIELILQTETRMYPTGTRNLRHLPTTPRVMAIRVVRSEEQWREEFAAVWAQYETDCGLVCEEEEVREGFVPFLQQPPLPAAMEEEVASTLQQLLDDGVVVKGYSNSNLPLAPKRKANGKVRLTLNCRALSKAAAAAGPGQVRLSTTELVATLSPQSRYFSVVDLSNASFAIPLATSSRALFAFTFRGQQYLFTRLPPGYHSTTSIVHRRVARMLSLLAPEDQPWVFSYVDDILITGKSQNETKVRTRRVLQLIQSTGFKAKFEKAQLVQPEVNYLGIAIGAKGRGIQASKLEAICKIPRPWHLHSLRSLLGRFASLQEHIPGYWELAWPLHRLSKTPARWEWSWKEDQALRSLKQAIEAAPTLRFPDKSQPFVIRLMTGEKALGASLLQEDEEGRLVPVGHSSRLLKTHELSFPLQEQRCLAAVWAVQEFQTLTGPAPILIQMPHSPRKYLLRGDVLGSHQPNPHPTQWTLLLVMGRGPRPEPGAPLVPTAPQLRLLPSHVPKANVWFTASKELRSVAFAATNLEERWVLGVAEAHLVPSAELVALWQLLCQHPRSEPLYLYASHSALVERLQSGWEWAPSGEGLWNNILRWVCDNPGVLHVRCAGEDVEEREWGQKAGRRASEMAAKASTGCRHLWEPSKHEKQEIIAQCHSWLHEGVQETLARVREVAPWEGDEEEVARWVWSCLECATGKEEEGTGRVEPQRAQGPWSQLQLSYIHGLPESQDGHRALLVVEDEFSGWVEAFPMRGEVLAEEIAEVLFRKVLARHGTPCTIRLPRAPRVFGHAMRRGMAATGMEFPWDILSGGRASQATVALRRVAQGAGKEWGKMLPLMLAGLRAEWARGAALSPCRLTLGFPLEMRLEREEEEEGGSCPQDRVLSWLRQLQKDEAPYKWQTEATLLRGYPEVDAPCL